MLKSVTSYKKHNYSTVGSIELTIYPKETVLYSTGIGTPNTIRYVAIGNTKDFTIKLK